MVETFAERMRRLNDVDLQQYDAVMNALPQGKVTLETHFNTLRVTNEQQTKLFLALFAAVQALAEKVQELEDRNG